MLILIFRRRKEVEKHGEIQRTLLRTSGNRESLYSGSNYNVRIPSFLYRHRSWLVAKLCKALVKNTRTHTRTHAHIHRESPSPLFKIDISHIRFYHAVTVTRHRYPLKNLSRRVLHISSFIGNLKDDGKSREKGRRKVCR